ncbi:hypothetical protein MCELHM10_01317 [Paracoccaceae bacterium]
MTIEEVSSLPLADGVSVWPGEQVSCEQGVLTYVGMLANSLGMIVLHTPSGERMTVHHLRCRAMAPQ